MKVILLEDVDKFGKVGEVKEVSEGHARNFLLPRGLAKAATAQSLKELEDKKLKTQKVKEREQEKGEKLARQLQGVRVVIKSKAADTGKLYGSVGQKEIAQALKIGLKPEHIILDQPIKQTGEHNVVIRVGSGQETKIKIIVESA